MRGGSSAINYEATIAAQYTDKERSGVNRTIETALARFADPELEDAFCTDAGAKANLADVLGGAYSSSTSRASDSNPPLTSSTTSSRNASSKRSTPARSRIFRLAANLHCDPPLSLLIKERRVRHSPKLSAYDLNSHDNLKYIIAG